MLIKFIYRKQFGREMLYPDNEAAEHACAIAERKVFKMVRIKDLLALGHEVQVTNDSNEPIDLNSSLALNDVKIKV